MPKPPRIVTASWFTPLPDNYARIGISRGPARGQRGYRMYRPLAPGDWFRSVTQGQYVRLYKEQLAALDPMAVVRKLEELAAGGIPALLCFEKPPPDPNWCHRGMVAGWLHDTLSIDVVEYGCEHDGCGWNHPKLPAGVRSHRPTKSSRNSGN